MSSGMARRREQLAGAQDGACPECTLPLPEDLAGTEVDHIIPRARGGPDVAWNRQLVHFKCNRAKRISLTDRALALAAEHGVTLRGPEARHGYRLPISFSPADLLGGEPLLFGGESEWLREHYRRLIEIRLATLARQEG